VYLSQLLGKLYNSSSVSELQPHLLYSDSIVANEERGTVSLRYEDSIFAVEDLVGMIFRFARQTAENYVNGPATDVVITVQLSHLTPSSSSCIALVLAIRADF